MTTITNLCPPILPAKSIPHLNLISWSSLACNPIHFGSKKREPRLPSVASVSCPPLDAGYLENEFGSQGNGVSFSNLGDDCIVKMEMENGSVARLMLPGGLITSYKASMWHGGTMELLHTSVSEGDNGEAAAIRGGVSLDFKCNVDGVVWSPNTWLLQGVKGNPQDSIQVELICQNAASNIEFKHIIRLTEDLLRSEIVVSNTSDSSSCTFEGAILSHLTVSTPEATYAIGLEGSDFSSRHPVSSDYSLVHPSFGNTGSSKQKGFLNNLLASWAAKGNRQHGDETIKEETTEGEEEENYKSLQEEMSRIYTSSPRSFTVLDRGRRNSVQLGREGFKELYLFSPGSSHEWYGDYAYVCVGQAALLQPITLNAQSQWKGKQQICNPNL
ncbi:OLC1v1038250C1 [Oldenlandia corymbosa var. corymbosa]|uniref:OLC1v1038250C1 n=1 Tax=Oldenlandia corymbosa var. corymbosa TaxID=529605 RepID=A0AAV1D2F6_OLDCO|nr:OLC1v1038250C1 [Oldenlandia corymbosa var. corymbosa]